MGSCPATEKFDPYLKRTYNKIIMKAFSIFEKSKTFLNLKVQDIVFLFSINLISYFVEIRLHQGDNILHEFLFKTLNVLVMILWFIRVSPTPGNLKNYILIFSLLVSNTYPYDSGFLNDRDQEVKISMLLPMVSYFLLILAFRINREIKRKEDRITFFFKFLFPFILVPVLFFYFVLYQALQQKNDYLLMVIVYLMVLLVMIYYGININFSRNSKKLVFYSLALITLTNELNAYNFFVEHFDWMFEIVRFLSIFSRVLLFCGFASEDIFRQKDATNYYH
jgi:hypothetical protein